MKFAAFSLPFLLICSTAASAEWQYTEWGMTPQEVISASNGQVYLAESDPHREWEGVDIGAEGTYRSGDYTFDSVFFFSEGKLVSVKLDLDSERLTEDAIKLRHSLYGAYGEPFNESFGSMTIVTWNDTDKNNRLDLIAVGDLSVVLQYRPLRDANSSGL